MSYQLNLYKTAGEVPLKNSKYRLPSLVTDGCVDTSKDSVASKSSKNGYHPPTCSSQKPSSHPQLSYCPSSPHPIRQEILPALLPNPSHPSPRLLTSTAIAVVPVTITSDLLSPLLPHSPLSTQQVGGRLRIYCLFPLTADPMEAHVPSGTSTKLDH